jgi:hypothetical protein
MNILFAVVASALAFPVAVRGKMFIEASRYIAGRFFA